jgi:hypothetical protein
MSESTAISRHLHHSRGHDLDAAALRFFPHQFGKGLVLAFVSVKEACLDGKCRIPAITPRNKCNFSAQPLDFGKNK